MQGKQKKKTYCGPLFVHITEAFMGVLACVRSAGLQPRNRKRLLCAPDGKSHGEGIREKGEWQKGGKI